MLRSQASLPFEMSLVLQKKHGHLDAQGNDCRGDKQVTKEKKKKKTRRFAKLQLCIEKVIEPPAAAPRHTHTRVNGRIRFRTCRRFSGFPSLCFA